MPDRPTTRTICYGYPGSGKSTLFATWPKPLLLLQTDPLDKEAPYLRRGVPGPPEAGQFGQCVVKVYSRKAPSPANPEDLPIVQVEQFLDEDLEKPLAWVAFRQRYTQVRDEVREGKWATVVLDSVSFLELINRAYQQYHPRSPYRDAKDGRRYFIGATDDLEKLFYSLGTLRCNVGICAHIDSERDDYYGSLLFNPAAPGRLRAKFAAGFSEVLLARVKRDPATGKTHYYLQTRSDERYGASSAKLLSPDPCEPHYDALFENWDKAGDQ